MGCKDSGVKLTFERRTATPVDLWCVVATDAALLQAGAAWLAKMARLAAPESMRSGEQG